MSRIVRASLMLLALIALFAPGHQVALAAPLVDPFPLTSADPSWGSRSAPVTLVHFSDLQCPFCARGSKELEELRKHYGPQKIRIVFKHMPLSFHKKARPAAEAAVAVHQLRGNTSFWTFIAATYASLRQSGPLDSLASVGLSEAVVKAAIRRGKAAAKVDADIALAQRVGVRGTPATFVNGIFMSGAQPAKKFMETIDEQLAAAAKLRKRGVPRALLSKKLTRDNFKAPAARAKARPSSLGARGGAIANSTEVWRIPVGKSPQLGPRNAPVTLVVFSDFQCPFCKRVDPTLKQLRKDYGNQLRVVFKHRVLPFHKRAEPAAQLAMHALKTAGPAAFWRAHDLLFERQRNLEDADLAKIAAELGMNPAATMRAVRSHRYEKLISADEQLADDVEARGTPHSFINGRRLVGARSIERFKSLIDEELAHAKKLQAKGVPAFRLYQHMMKAGKTAPSPVRKRIAPATAANPSKGSPRAPVTITIFSDFQCPFCQRVLPTLKSIEQEFGSQVRFVFRHRPLAFHKQAMLAHQAAAEAFAQGGSAGFWKMHDWLFSHQKDFELDRILDAAKDMGFNVRRMRAAITNGVHKAAIKRDVQVAESASIGGTPGFVINGEFLSGAQPISKFRAAIRRASSPHIARRP